ncbi:MAG: putative collagen-binding domain-containing protein, partial [Bacteroidota bacterium]
YFRDYDVRKQLYRSVFAGACGVTYGHQAIRQFYSPRVAPAGYPDRYWTEALDRPGAFQAGYLKRLILSRPPLNRIPDQSIIASGQGEKGEHIIAFRDTDNSYGMVYLPVGKKIEVNASWLNADKLKAWWFNPRNGETHKIGIFDRINSLSFDPPSRGIENDWVLVLEDADKNWSAPGNYSNN